MKQTGGRFDSGCSFDDLPDYNDGNWWGWNCGECPVHPKSSVYGIEPGNVWWIAIAEDCDWSSFRGAFRVVKEHKEPREFWLVYDGANLIRVSERFEPHRDGCEVIHVREVLA